MANRVSTKLYIQHPADPAIQLVGILEQLEHSESTQGRKIALVRALYRLE